MKTTGLAAAVPLTFAGWPSIALAQTTGELQTATIEDLMKIIGSPQAPRRLSIGVDVRIGK